MHLAIQSLDDVPEPHFSIQFSFYSHSKGFFRPEMAARHSLVRCLVAMVEDTPCIQVVRVSADGSQQTAEGLNLDRKEASAA